MKNSPNSICKLVLHRGNLSTTKHTSIQNRDLSILHQVELCDVSTSTNSFPYTRSNNRIKMDSSLLGHRLAEHAEVRRSDGTNSVARPRRSSLARQNARVESEERREKYSTPCSLASLIETNFHEFLDGK